MSLVPFRASPPVRVFLLPVLFPIPDLTQISHTRTDRSTHRFNANVAYGLTPSHSIAF
jgi:hypothetical protein